MKLAEQLRELTKAATHPRYIPVEQSFLRHMTQAQMDLLTFARTHADTIAAALELAEAADAYDKAEQVPVSLRLRALNTRETEQLAKALTAYRTASEGRHG